MTAFAKKHRCWLRLNDLDVANIHAIINEMGRPISMAAYLHAAVIKQIDEDRLKYLNKSVDNRQP